MERLRSKRDKLMGLVSSYEESFALEAELGEVDPKDDDRCRGHPELCHTFNKLEVLRRQVLEIRAELENEKPMDKRVAAAKAERRAKLVQQEKAQGRLQKHKDAMAAALAGIQHEEQVVSDITASLGRCDDKLGKLEAELAEREPGGAADGAKPVEEPATDKAQALLKLLDLYGSCEAMGSELQKIAAERSAAAANRLFGPPAKAPGAPPAEPTPAVPPASAAAEGAPPEGSAPAAPPGAAAAAAAAVASAKAGAAASGDSLPRAPVNVLPASAPARRGRRGKDAQDEPEEPEDKKHREGRSRSKSPRKGMEVA